MIGLEITNPHYKTLFISKQFANLKRQIKAGCVVFTTHPVFVYLAKSSL